MVIPKCCGNLTHALAPKRVVLKTQLLPWSSQEHRQPPQADGTCAHLHMHAPLLGQPLRGDGGARARQEALLRNVATPGRGARASNIP